MVVVVVVAVVVVVTPLLPASYSTMNPKHPEILNPSGLLQLYRARKDFNHHDIGALKISIGLRGILHSNNNL